MDTKTQYSAKFAEEKIFGKGEISAVLVLGDFVLITNRKTNRLLILSKEMDEKKNVHFSKTQRGRSGTLADMAKVSPSRFAVLCTGRFSASKCWIYDLTDDQGSIELPMVKEISLERGCTSICFQRESFFASFSPLFGSHGYIRQMNHHGSNIRKFKNDEVNESLFGKNVLILHVDSELIMYVCDVERKELQVLKKDNECELLTKETSHRYRVIDIAVSNRGPFYLLTDSSDGIVLLHRDRKWTFNSFLPKSKLGGTPTAVVCIKSPKLRLMFAVSYGSICKKTKLLFFDLIENASGADASDFEP
ncbi:hypothetical protein DPMN_121032 [Dreissena polymorpha]|uniref:Uncharacterized protein n=1 Tax=Dreissena polymorpha TaxID=45954 RepID=A0A9D4GPF5_DREPO|nr:hypothetical protein DPMN_121032 [Dreissena polymorpha]